jgi:hypothetical protein
MTCSICLSNCVDKITTTCNHTFCRQCISQWTTNNNTCPNCRTTINKVNLNTNTNTNSISINISPWDSNGNLIKKRQNYLDLYMDGDLTYGNLIGLDV